jgi:phage baseplate assembly protein V
VKDVVERLWKRIRAGAAVGQITAVDDTGPVQMHQVQVGYLELHDKIPAVQHYGFVSNPPIGTDVVLHFTSGDRSNGFETGTNNQGKRMRNLASGECALHDDRGRFIYLSTGGIVVQANGASVTIENASTIIAQATVKMRVESPLLECTGDILDNCDTQTENQAGQRANFNIHNHPVRNIQTGGSTINTDVPNQQEA